MNGYTKCFNGANVVQTTCPTSLLGYFLLGLRVLRACDVYSLLASLGYRTSSGILIDAPCPAYNKHSFPLLGGKRIWIIRAYKLSTSFEVWGWVPLTCTL